jgi:predicted choloylglycine hydrolase
MADPVILMILEPEGGRSSIVMCKMDLLLGAIDGVNDAGFCAALLSLAGGPAPTAPRSDAFHELSVVRVLLENCATVEEAIAGFRDLPLYTIFLPCLYIVADRTGDRAVLEWNGREARVVRGDRAEALVCTNHSLSGETSPETRTPEGAHSRKRHRLLSDMLRLVTIEPDMLRQAAEAVRLDAFQDGGAIYGGTLWTSLYDPASPRLEVRVLSGFGQGRPIYGKSVSVYFAKPTHRS